MFHRPFFHLLSKNPFLQIFLDFLLLIDVDVYVNVVLETINVGLVHAVLSVHLLFHASLRQLIMLLTVFPIPRFDLLQTLILCPIYIFRFLVFICSSSVSVGLDMSFNTFENLLTLERPRRDRTFSRTVHVEILRIFVTCKPQHFLFQQRIGLILGKSVVILFFDNFHF